MKKEKSKRMIKEGKMKDRKNIGRSDTNERSKKRRI
jgi:hypothetical protein